MLEHLAEAALPALPNKLYCGFAYDGDQFYLSSSDKQVLILDDTYVQTCSKPTHRFYYALCYDPVLKCFWAAAYKNPGILFRLSQDFQEEEQIRLAFHDCCLGTITGLSYDFCQDRLLLICDNHFYACDRQGNLQLLIDWHCCGEQILCLCAIPEGLLYLSVREQVSYLVLLSYTDAKIIEQFRIPPQYHATSMQVSASKKCHTVYIYALQNCYHPCLLTCKVGVHAHSCTHDTDETSQDPYEPAGPQDSFPHTSCCNTPKRTAGPEAGLLNFLMGGLISDLLHTHAPAPANQSAGCCPKPILPPAHCCPPKPPCPPFDPCCEPPCEHCCPPKPPCPPPWPPYPPCPPPWPPCPPCPPPHPPCPPEHCCHACADVLESIALAEASIAHILNAEGEKLQKVIAANYNFHELIQVNDSVQKTVIYATYLEQVLTNKLEAALKAPCCHCPHPDPGPGPHPCPHPCPPNPCHHEPPCCEEPCCRVDERDA